ncbi:Uncharacterised protein [Candidatus Tiddalikarchaeum anstoanum]|nr:Uncharacterised protein [Candidatus Tiddalikarchaeum anstoanum]
MVGEKKFNDLNMTIIPLLESKLLNAGCNFLYLDCLKRQYIFKYVDEKGLVSNELLFKNMKSYYNNLKRIMPKIIGGLLCRQKIHAESQRIMELERYDTDINCSGYYDAGCYDCEGFDKSCGFYTKKPEIF